MVRSQHGSGPWKHTTGIYDGRYRSEGPARGARGPRTSLQTVRKCPCPHAKMAETKASASFVASEPYVDSLMRRLEVLEKRLVGDHGVREGQPPLKSTVGDLHQKLNSLSKGSVVEVWEKIASLEKVLSPEYESYLKLSDNSKAELLMGYAAQLKPLCEKAEEIQKLKDYLHTTEFQGLDSHEKKLAVIANLHVQQEMQVQALRQQTEELLRVYNRILLQLSGQCVEWEEVISQCESGSR